MCSRWVPRASRARLLACHSAPLAHLSCPSALLALSLALSFFLCLSLSRSPWSGGAKLPALLASLRTCLATLLSHCAGALTDCLLPWSAAGVGATHGQAPEWPSHRRPACYSSRAGSGLQRGRGWLSLHHGHPLPRHRRALAGRIGRPLLCVRDEAEEGSWASIRRKAGGEV
jgi:hypothetical protein